VRPSIQRPNWSDSANTSVSILRTEAGRNPYNKPDRPGRGAVARSEEFRTRWAAHNVRLHRSWTTHVLHPAVGDLHLSFDALELPGDPGLALAAYSAEPGTLSADNLALLASWAAANVEAAPARPARPLTANRPTKDDHGTATCQPDR
jgi:MmyB-like transcription regulator ligand binding domain